MAAGTAQKVTLSLQIETSADSVILFSSLIQFSPFLSHDCFLNILQEPRTWYTLLLNLILPITRSYSRRCASYLTLLYSQYQYFVWKVSFSTHICESTIFKTQKNTENNLTERVLIFFNRQCNTTDCISDQLYSKKRKLLCKTATALWLIKHNTTYKWSLKCNLGHANAHLSYKGRNRNTFSINMEVPPRYLEEDQDFSSWLIWLLVHS